MTMTRTPQLSCRHWPRTLAASAALALGGSAGLAAAQTSGSSTTEQRPYQQTQGQQSQEGQQNQGQQDQWQQGQRSQDQQARGQQSQGMAGQQELSPEQRQRAQQMQRDIQEKSQRFAEMIREDLQKAGVDERQSALQVEQIALGMAQLEVIYETGLKDLHDGYARTLSMMSDELSEQEAQRQAADLIKTFDDEAQVKRDALIQQAASGQRGDNAQSRRSGMSGDQDRDRAAWGTASDRAGEQAQGSEKAQIRRALQQARVSQDKIDELAQDDFEEESLKEAVKDAQTRMGVSDKQAEDKADQVVRQVEELKNGSSPEANSESSDDESRQADAAR